MKEQWESYSHLMWLFGLFAGILFGYAIVNIVNGNYIYSIISFAIGVVINVISEKISKPDVDKPKSRGKKKT